MEDVRGVARDERRRRPQQCARAVRPHGAAAGAGHVRAPVRARARASASRDADDHGAARQPAGRVGAQVGVGDAEAAGGAASRRVVGERRPPPRAAARAGSTRDARAASRRPRRRPTRSPAAREVLEGVEQRLGAEVERVVVRERDAVDAERGRASRRPPAARGSRTSCRHRATPPAVGDAALEVEHEAASAARGAPRRARVRRASRPAPRERLRHLAAEHRVAGEGRAMSAMGVSRPGDETGDATACPSGAAARRPGPGDSHEREDEIFLVTDGTMTFLVGETATRWGRSCASGGDEQLANPGAPATGSTSGGSWRLALAALPWPAPR